MDLNWNFQRETGFSEIPEGEYRVRIVSAEKATSKSGNDMLVIKMDVSGQTASIWNYITFLPDNPQMTNRMLTQYFDSFGIAEGEYFNLASHAGKVGAAKIKHDTEGKARIHYFLDKKKQDNLPPWRDAGTNVNYGAIPEDDNRLPF